MTDSPESSFVVKDAKLTVLHLSSITDYRVLASSDCRPNFYRQQRLSDSSPFTSSLVLLF